jgi:hypothetical protein
MRRYRSMLLAGCFLLVILGCSSDTSIPTANVKGKIEYKGKTMTGGTISFVIDGGKDSRSGSALIKSDGTYEVKDAPIGNTKVVVKPAQNAGVNQADNPQPYAGTNVPKGANIPGMPPGTPINKTAPKVTPDKIPGKFGKAESTTLTFDVKKGSNEYNVTLTD